MPGHVKPALGRQDRLEAGGSHVRITELCRTRGEHPSRRPRRAALAGSPKPRAGSRIRTRRSAHRSEPRSGADRPPERPTHRRPINARLAASALRRPRDSRRREGSPPDDVHRRPTPPQIPRPPRRLSTYGGAPRPPERDLAFMGHGDRLFHHQRCAAGSEHTAARGVNLARRRRRDSTLTHRRKRESGRRAGPAPLRPHHRHRRRRRMGRAGR